MTPGPGAELLLAVEKPAVGGRMLARHEGQVVLVQGAIPGERVRARVTKAVTGLLHADTIEVVTASPDRREPTGDWRCGGHVLAHVVYARQVRLKGEMVQDALGRIGGVRLATPPPVTGSPGRGYRMRARLRVHDGRPGYFREGTHDLCDPAVTGQLLPATEAWLASLTGLLARMPSVRDLELAENVTGDERALHVEVTGETASAAALAALLEAGPLTGLSAHVAGRPASEIIAGAPAVSDTLHGRDGDSGTAFRLRRGVHAFFQSNRYLLSTLVGDVLRAVPPGPVLELYAGVGLFGLALASVGFDRVTMVEGDPIGAADLAGNAEPFGHRVRVVRDSVEAFLRRARAVPGTTLLIDPPRTGVSKAARAGIVALRPDRILYVSCDVATLARDARAFLEAGYGLESLHGLDMFPNTAHVESVAVFAR